MPSKISEIKDNQVLVFESNLAGLHHDGMAKWAITNLIARHGQGMGMCFTENGSSYAVAIQDYDMKFLDLHIIDAQIEILLKSARLLPEKEFLVTPIGTGYACYPVADIAPLFFEEFADAEDPRAEFANHYPNVWLPDEFWKVDL